MEVGSGLNTERGSATASLLGVGIIKNKALAVESTLKIKGHTNKVEVACGIDDNFSSVGLKGFVSLFVFSIKIHLIGHA